MKNIGRGWQYTVYDIGDGRIRKCFNTKYQAYLVFIKECFPYTQFPIWRFPNLYNNMRRKAQVSLSWIRTTTLPLDTFGNPKILDGVDYEQDMAVPLSKYMKNLSLTEGKLIIDKFVTLNRYLIANEVIDKSFLIGKNYGINQNGEIVLTDIGELFIGQEMIQAQIELRPWDHPYVKKSIPKRFRSYFIEVMDKNLPIKLSR